MFGSEELNLDLSGYETTGFNLLPEGQYNLLITACELKETKAATGKYLDITFKVVGGEKSGSILKHKINIINPNKKAEDIGRAEAKKILELNEKEPKLASANDLVLLKVKAMVKVRKQEGYEDSNSISYYKKFDDESIGF